MLCLCVMSKICKMQNAKKKLKKSGKNKKNKKNKKAKQKTQKKTTPFFSRLALSIDSLKKN